MRRPLRAVAVHARNVIGRWGCGGKDERRSGTLLREIDENLIRANLSPAEEAAHNERRQELYEKRHPETVSVRKRGGPGRGKKKNERQNVDSLAAPYSDDAAKKPARLARL
jgi:hypothetical protein